MAFGLSIAANIALAKSSTWTKLRFIGFRYFPWEVWINGWNECNTHDMRQSAIIANSFGYGCRFNVECFWGDAEFAAGNHDWLSVMARVAKAPKANTTLVAKTRRKSASKMASEIGERLSALPGGGTSQPGTGQPGG